MIRPLTEAEWLAVLNVIHASPRHIPAHWVDQVRECLYAVGGIAHPVEAIQAARDALERADKLVRLLTIRQVINAGDSAIEASGLNPWALNEGADPDSGIGAHFIGHALSLLNPTEATK